MLWVLNVALFLVVAIAFAFAHLDPLLKAGLLIACLAQAGRRLLFDSAVRRHVSASRAGGIRGIALAHVVSGLLIASGALRSGGPVGAVLEIEALC